MSDYLDSHPEFDQEECGGTCGMCDDCTGVAQIPSKQVVREQLELMHAQQLRRAFNLPDEPFPLEIAAGERPTDGFIHNDARSLEHIEIVADAVTELPEIVGQGGASFVRACHVLEHFPYNDTVNVLLRWASMLMSGGGLHIEVPNVMWQATALASGEITGSEFVYFCFGEQNYEGNFHYAGFTIEILQDVLQESGFVDINVTDIGQVLVATAIKP